MDKTAQTHIKNTTTITLPASQKIIKKIIPAILKYLSQESWSVGVIFLTDRKIKQLNRTFFGKDEPTDVISFNYAGRFGELAISLETAKRNAEIYKTSFGYEVILYIIHGILHLSGYRDGTPGARKKMEAKQKQLLGKIMRRYGYP